MDSETWIWLWTMPVISLLLLAALFAQSSATAPGIDAFRQGRFAEARKMLEQAAAANPSDAAAGAFLAMTKAALHDCAPAALVFTTSPDSTLARMSGLAAVECESAVNRNVERLRAADKDGGAILRPTPTYSTVPLSYTAPHGIPR